MAWITSARAGRQSARAGAQPWPLRVLAERERLPVGATRPVKVDVRVIAATHADLPELVRSGRFRSDHYYRLAGAHLRLPPLRERSDLSWLIARMLQDDGRGLRLTAETERCLQAHAWPGNLRELRNVIDYARAMVGDDGVIGLDDQPDTLSSRGAAPDAPRIAGEAGRDEQLPEAQLLLQYLRAAHWNVSSVAHQLGVARMTVYRRMRRWGIERPHHGGG